jgi:lysophospholipid acyltransferase (LPLAT)-like uncharacterized protein
MRKVLITILLFIIRVWASSWRFKGSLPEDKTCVMLFWHEDLLAISKAAAGKNWIAVVSPSADGDYLESIISKWKINLLRGSSFKNPARTLAKIIALAADNKIATGCDGPRGPRRKVKPGLIIAASKTGVPLYLVGIKANGTRLSKTWDKTLIPWPFAQITIFKSAPIYIKPDLSKDELHTLVQEYSILLDNLSK